MDLPNVLAATLVWFVTRGDGLPAGLRVALELLAWSLGTGPMPALNPTCSWLPGA